MATRRPFAKRKYWNNALRRIERKAQERAEIVAQMIVQEIAHMPEPRPYDESARHEGIHVVDSYYVDVGPRGGVTIKSRVRYWAFVEYGTGNHKAQPHIQPAKDAVEAALR